MLARSSIQTSRSPAAAPVYVGVLGTRAADGRDRPVDRADHVREADLGRRPRQPVAALGAALARDDLRAAQLERMFSRNLSGISCAVASRSAFTGPGGAAASSASARSA